MTALFRAFDIAIKSGNFSQNPIPEEISFKNLEALLLQDNFKHHDPLNLLIQKALDLNLTPYLKRHGPNVVNKNYRYGDLIGIYFAKQVTLNINQRLTVSRKFCGFDITQSTLNFQLYAPDRAPDERIKELANKYNGSLVNGSFRVPISSPEITRIVDNFISFS